MRGYYGIGVYHGKTSMNIGTLWRSAYTFGASFIFTIGKRYEKQATDTTKTIRHIPLWHFMDWKDFNDHSPYDCRVVCIEITSAAKNLSNFVHPERAIYLLGAEDTGIPEDILFGKTKLVINTQREFCLNVATAGSIIMYDRYIKELLEEKK